MESKEINTIKGNQPDSGSDSEAIKTELNPQGSQDFKTVSPESDDNANIYSQGGKNFRTLKRWDTIFILFANQIGLGILSLPSTLMTLGIVPGLIALIGIGVLSWYTAYELLQYYRLHPQVVNVVEMTRFVGGPWLEGVAGVMMMIQVIFVAASAIVTLSIALNTISSHATCTVVFIFVACAACFLLCLPRTTKFVSNLGVPNAVSVLAASILVMISLGIKGPRQVDSIDDWHRDIVVIGHPSFRDGLNACLKIVFAYAANLSFVGYMAEMKDPIKDFKFCLAFLEGSCITLYSAFAIIFYCLGAEYTTSPILGATSSTPAKAAYGVVLPAIYSTGLAYGHIGAKYIFVNVMRWMGAVHEVTSDTVRSWSVWLASVIVFWIIVFILSNAIPIFDSILSITSATTISWFTYGFSAVFWFHMNWDNLFRDWKKICLTLLNAFLIIISLFMNAAGLWASITELLDLFNADDSSIRGVFSCGSNAQF
ncbi:hypothetical protein Neosp_008993 [[Neocosmospora] mangrovei]